MSPVWWLGLGVALALPMGVVVGLCLSVWMDMRSRAREDAVEDAGG